MATENVHKNHRSRVRKKFLLDGLDSFEKHEALEFLMFYCVPYKNTSELAHRLIDSFGSISAVWPWESWGCCLPWDLLCTWASANAA